MAEIINLRRARKARGRADKAAQAQANRAAHGRTKADRLLAQAQAAKSASILDGARRDPGKHTAPFDDPP